MVVAAVGAVLTGYGLLTLSTSLLGGAWLAVSGLCLLISGVFATAWAGERSGLSAERRRAVSVAFGLLGAALLVLFVVVNGATFESGSSGG